MNKKYFSVVAALFLGLTMSSCSDLLDTVNKSNPQTDDEYFSTNPEALLTTAYASLQPLASQVDIYENGTDLYINTRGKNGGSLNEYTINPEDPTVTSFYQSLYNTINFANGVLNYSSEDSELGAQARFIRGYCYYLLSQHFGGVPYITTYIKTSEREYPRVELGELYSNVIADLENVYSLGKLPEVDHATGKVSSQAVCALLAKFYLAKAWDLGTSLNSAEEGTYTVTSTDDFARAASWAEKAIGGESLDLSNAQVWSYIQEDNHENIFSVNYRRENYPGSVEDGGHSLQNDFGGYYGACTTTGYKNVGSCNQQSLKSMYLFEKGDARYEDTYMTVFYNCSSASNWGTEGYFAAYTQPDTAKLHIGLRFFPYYVTESEVKAEVNAHQGQYSSIGQVNNVIVTILSNPVKCFNISADGKIGAANTYSVNDYNNMTNNGVCVKKFDDPESAQVTGKNDYRNIVIYRLADMYLTAAEAYLLAGQKDKALNYINAVRTRAELAALASFDDYKPAYTTKLKLNELDLLLDERAREFYAENQRWMDLRRTKQLIRYNVEYNDYVSSAAAMKGQDGNYKWLRPIPQGAIDKNTGISIENQNPGY